jgi:hypothetical protein
MSEIEVLRQIKEQLLKFLDDLILALPEEGDLVILRVFISDIPANTIAQYIVTNLCPLQDLIKQRREDFFLKHNVLFDKFSPDKLEKVNHFKQLWESNRLEAEDKDAIWSWFNIFIALGNKYKIITEKRQCQ